MAEGNDENRLIAERRAKLAKLREGGVAYPNDFRRDALAAQLHTAFGERAATWFDENAQTVSVGGRLMLKRVMGKASFATLQDRTGQIQLFLQQGPLEEAYEQFKRGISATSSERRACCSRPRPVSSPSG